MMKGTPVMVAISTRMADIAPGGLAKLAVFLFLLGQYFRLSGERLDAALVGVG
jgi:hypothetical protein